MVTAARQRRRLKTKENCDEERLFTRSYFLREIGIFLAVVVVKWSTSLPSTLTIRDRILAAAEFLGIFLLCT